MAKKKLSPHKPGTIAWTEHFVAITGAVLGIPTDAKVMILEHRNGRYKVRPDDSRFPEAWVDPSSLRFK